MKIAKVRHRLMASLVDLSIVVAMFAFIALSKLPFLISMFRSGGEHTVSTKFILDMLRWGSLFTVIIIIYYSIIPLLMKGQSIGKKIFKLKIVKENGEEVDLKTMLFREMVGGIFVNIASLGLTAISSIVVMSLREDKRDLADIIAKTKVIDIYEREE